MMPTPGLPAEPSPTVSAARPRRLRWEGQLMPDGGLFHVARSRFTPRLPLSRHTHDFAEVFWIERGRGQHHINGHAQPLSAGDVVFIRAADVHGFRTADRDGFVMVNIAFPSRVLTPLRRRYFGDDPAEPRWPWRDGPMPMTASLTSAAQDRLAGWTEQLAAMSQRRMELDAFLLDLLNTLSREPRPAEALPQWLAEAVGRMQRPEDLAGGAPRLAALAHRSPEHVNRVVRQHLGKTATELVNDMRLERAARLLRMTSRPIIDVAHEAGFANLSYFHRRFRTRFHHSPRRYRLAQQAVPR